MHRSGGNVHHYTQRTHLVALTTTYCLTSFTFVAFTKTDNLIFANHLVSVG